MNSRRSEDQTPDPKGRFSYGGLDRVLHEKARLGILTSLAAHPEGLLFNDLKALCDLTDGNLNRHLAVLEEAALIEIWKGAQQKRPQTMCRLTASGRQRFFEYIDELQRVISDAHAAETQTQGNPGALSRGWSPA